MKTGAFCLGLIVLTGSVPAEAAGAPAERSYLDIPVTQSIDRDGVIRYAVWLKVGERFVQAMIDTGSTGLRVLPTVLPNVTDGAPTDVAFGAGIHMQGLKVKVPVEIGSAKGVAPVEVIGRIGCIEGRVDCDPGAVGRDGYLIGGDGYPSQGYSAILGIGFPFHHGDLENPLEALGIKAWIIDLPRPYDPGDGHLILDPDAGARGAFQMLPRSGIADADGCIQGGSLREATCGTVLFDTGAPEMEVAIDGVKTAATWADDAAGILTLGSDAKAVKLAFQVGKSADLIAVRTTPPKQKDPPEPFILAGVYPYFTYDILYDAADHVVGLKLRSPMPVPPILAAAAGSPDTRPYP